MATTQITGLNPIGVVNDSDLILIHSGVEDFKGTVTDLKTNLNNTYLKITDNLTTVQDKPAAFNAIKQPATTTSSGVLEIADNAETITGTDTSRAVVPSGLKAAMTDRDVLAGNGLTGGGNLGSDVTLNMGTPSTITSTSTNSVTADSHTHAISLTVATPEDIKTGTDNVKPVTSYGLYNNYDLGDRTVTVGAGFTYPDLASAINFLKTRRRHLLKNTAEAIYTISVSSDIDDKLYLENEDLSWLVIKFENVPFSGNITCKRSKSPLFKGTITTFSSSGAAFSITDGSELKMSYFSMNTTNSTIISLIRDSKVILESCTIVSDNGAINLFNNSEISTTGSNFTVKGTSGISIASGSKGTFWYSTITGSNSTTSGEALVKVHQASECKISNSTVKRLTSTGNSIQVGGNDVGEGACIGKLVGSFFTYGADLTSSQDIYCGQRSIVMKDGCTGGTASAGTGVVY